jgi:hypothetical protein
MDTGGGERRIGFLVRKGVWPTVKIPIPRDGLKHDAILVEAN